MNSSNLYVSNDDVEAVVNLSVCSYFYIEQVAAYYRIVFEYANNRPLGFNFKTKEHAQRVYNALKGYLNRIIEVTNC